MKIKINQIECKSGSAVIQKNGYLSVWSGEAEFKQPQRIIRSQKTGKAIYYGPLKGCGIDLDEIFGDILIIEWKQDPINTNLIKGIRFIGKGAPFVPLSISKDTAEEEKTKMYFVIQPSDGGSLIRYETKAELNSMLSTYTREPIFLNDTESEIIYLEDWKSKSMLIIKGKIVIPKPAQVVQKYEIE